MEQLIRIPAEIPFYSQHVTAENYAAEGYATLEEGLSWTARSCGIACVRMVIDAHRALRGLPPCGTQGEMLRRCKEMGGYKDGVGWIHQKLLELAALYGVRGACRRGGTPSDIRAEIEAGRPCIVSVSPRFSGGMAREDGTPAPKGGHLVVLYGVYTENGALSGVLTRHPSCFPAFSRALWRASAEEFAASFSGNYIVFDVL